LLLLVVVAVVMVLLLAGTQVLLLALPLMSPQLVPMLEVLGLPQLLLMVVAVVVMVYELLFLWLHSCQLLRLPFPGNSCLLL
jgi:hypothetical protein